MASECGNNWFRHSLPLSPLLPAPTFIPNLLPRRLVSRVSLSLRGKLDATKGSQRKHFISKLHPQPDWDPRH